MGFIYKLFTHLLNKMLLVILHLQSKATASACIPNTLFVTDHEFIVFLFPPNPAEPEPSAFWYIEG